MKIYHTETQEDYDALMIELEEQGCLWIDGEPPTQYDLWLFHRNKTAIYIKNRALNYNSKSFYESKRPDIPIIKYTAKKENKTFLPEWANWLARDEDGVLYAFENKPLLYEKGEWVPQLIDGTMEYSHIEETDDTFKHIKWTDEEPTSVKALIKEFLDEAESLRELGETLTRNWEAEHGKPSVAEYNQWQITQAKAHGYDEVPEVADKTERVYVLKDGAKITVDETHSISFEEAMALVENKVDDISDNRYEKHRNLVDELHKIYVAKNKDYGNSFGESIDEFGIIAGVIRIGDKYNRLKTLAKGHEPLVNDESMVDTLKDMANYCLLTIIELEAIE